MFLSGWFFIRKYKIRLFFLLKTLVIILLLRNDDEMYKMIISNYEDKEKVLNKISLNHLLLLLEGT